MAQQGRHKTARKVIAEKLRAGEVINPDDVAELIELTITETAARALFTRTYISRLVHSEARALGLIAVSLGPGRGLKAVTTPEDIELARSRARSQVKGQATRGKRLLEKMRRLNQYEFPLEEVMVDVGFHTRADAERKPAKAISA